MKRFVAVLSGLLVLPAFAEVAPTYYDDMIEMVDADVVVDDAGENNDSSMSDEGAVTRPVVQPAPVVAGRNATTGRAISRAVPGASTGVATSRATPAAGTGAVTSRAIASRGGESGRNTVSRAAGTARSTTNRATVARTGATTARAGTTGASVVSPVVTSDNASRAAVNNTTNRRTTSNSASNASVARAGTTSSIVQTDTVNTPLYTGRVGMRTNVKSRVPTVRVATGTGISADSTAAAAAAPTAAEVTNAMDELAQLTDFCKAQYTQCMDNFCNVLDDNQGRCSCSANLTKYDKTATALKQATEELKDVAQKLQYIGLTAGEIETLFSQTEAEMQMQKTTDSTQLKNDLDRIKKLLVEVKSTSSASSEGGISMDLSGLLDFSIDSTGFDLSSLFGTNNTTNSITNQRGEQLYKSASARCKTAVLNNCGAQGVDTALLVNAYDMEIDKQCVAYERQLTDSNDQMASTVRNAKSVLQKARLMVSQNKNQYDLRGCISALDSCVQDDYVCGTDYENCLDPTGKYIVNGTVVSGSLPGIPGGEVDDSDTMSGLYAAWNYEGASGKTTAWGKKGNISEFIEKDMLTKAADFGASKNRQNMVGYLIQKIGYIADDGTAQGMCASVLNKCQKFSFEGTGNKAQYDFENQVLKQYLERALVQIKTAQDNLLSDYSESCLSDVVSCISQNDYTRTYQQNGSTENSTTDGTEYPAMALKACYSVAASCKSVMEPGSYDIKSLKNWFESATNNKIKE